MINYHKNKFFAGKVTLYFNSSNRTFIEKDKAEYYLLNKKIHSYKIAALKHVCCGYINEDNTCLLTFYTSNEYTKLHKITEPVKNIKTYSDFKYLNPLWLTNVEEIEKFYHIDNNINNFPQNFIYKDKLNNEKYSKEELAQLIFQDLRKAFEYSLIK